MKKLTFVAALAIAAATFTGCGNSTPKADLKTDIDTLSYAMGMSQTQGLKDFLVARMNIDTTYMDQFIKGLNEGANAGDDKARAAYYAGLQIGQPVSYTHLAVYKRQTYKSRMLALARRLRKLLTMIKALERMIVRYIKRHINTIIAKGLIRNSLSSLLL